MKILLFFLLLPIWIQAQLSKKDSLWLPFKNMLGTWVGTGEGGDGKGQYERSYTLVLNKNYIEVKNKSIYPPNEKNKNGYHHEDQGFISYDKMRKKFVFRQFHIEGYMNQYTLENSTDDNMTFTFVSESIENIPSGWRAKEVYTLSSNQLNEVFYLAAPSKDFEEYTKATLTKVEQTAPDKSANTQLTFDQYLKPGPQHQWMQKLNGTWKAEIRHWMNENGTPEIATAKNVFITSLNGLFLEGKLTGKIFGSKMEGKSLLGYDNAKKEFVLTWIDNMGSGMTFMTGQYDEASKTLKMKGTQTSPLDGKDIPIKQETQYPNENTFIQSLFMQGPDGREMKFMEGKFVRNR